MTHLKNLDGSASPFRPNRQCQACVHFVQSTKLDGRGMCVFYNQIVGSSDDCASFEAKVRTPDGRVQRA